MFKQASQAVEGVSDQKRHFFLEIIRKYFIEECSSEFSKPFISKNLNKSLT